MPCTTALHIGERAPDIAAIIFKDRNGCFEKPSLDKEPSYLSLPKLKVKLRSRYEVGSYVWLYSSLRLSRLDSAIFLLWQSLAAMNILRQGTLISTLLVTVSTIPRLETLTLRSYNKLSVLVSSQVPAVWLPQYWLRGRTEVCQNERSRISEPLQEPKETKVYSLMWMCVCVYPFTR